MPRWCNNAYWLKCAGLEAPLTECAHASAIEHSVPSAARDANFGYTSCFDVDAYNEDSAAGKMKCARFEGIIRLRAVLQRLCSLCPNRSQLFRG
ncbi:MAG: hypothetical protein QOI04_256 [Verrucomicrobiota bacterium]